MRWTWSQVDSSAIGARMAASHINAMLLPGAPTQPKRTSASTTISNRWRPTASCGNWPISTRQCISKSRRTMAIVERSCPHITHTLDLAWRLKIIISGSSNFTSQDMCDSIHFRSAQSARPRCCWQASCSTRSIFSMRSMSATNHCQLHLIPLGCARRDLTACPTILWC